MNSVKKKWEYFGETDPYFAVATFDKFKNENLDDKSLTNFFETGEEYIERIWREIEDNFQTDFHPRRAVDFGCGVGRITLAMAKRCENVVGVDISENMLKEGRKNAEKFNLANIEFVRGDEDLTKVSGKFDFIHSFIVFQHIKPKTGERIFEELVKMLADGGIGALHFAYGDNQSSNAQKIRSAMYRNFPRTHQFRNFLLKKTDYFIPFYFYNLNRLFSILRANNCHKCQIRFSHHGAEGALLFFEKKSEKSY